MPGRSPRSAEAHGLSSLVAGAPKASWTPLSCVEFRRNSCWPVCRAGRLAPTARSGGASDSGPSDSQNPLPRYPAREDPNLRFLEGNNLGSVELRITKETLVRQD